MAELIIPTLPSLLVNKGSKYDVYYVYTYQNVWNSEKKRSERKNSKKVGVIHGGTKDGLIQWDESFIQQYPELEHIDTFRENGKYIFKPKAYDETTAPTIERPSKIYHAGATYALDNIVAQSHLGKALANAFPQHNDFKKILSVAYFLILNRDNNISLYEDFAESTRLPYQRELSSSAIHRLFARIEPHDVERFIQFMTDYFIKHNYKDDENIFLAFDSTSISTHSQNLSLAEYGKNKDGDEMPQINVLMLTDQKTGIPLYYRAYNGAVPDVVTLRRTIADATRHNFNKNLVFVMDKAYPSAANLNDCMRNNVSFVANMKTNVAGSFTQDEINANYNDLISRASYNRQIKQNIFTVKIKWKYDAYPVHGKNKSYKDEKELFLHLYYDQQIHNKSSEVITQNAALVCEILNNGGEIKHEALKSIKERFVVFDDKRKAWIISDLKVEEHIKYKGIRALLTDCEQDAVKCYEAYYDRNEVEYAFNTLKYRLHCNRAKCHTNEGFYGRIFTQFIATSIAIMFRKRIKEFKNNIKSANIRNKVLYCSDNKLLSSLNNIMLLVTQRGNFYDEVVGKKADFFRALNIEIPCSTKDGYDLISGLTDENENDIDAEDPIFDDIFA
ncbi:IS1634 family transposase [Anaerobiospirillum thomasii]|uniref:Transposase n=1 Tax=Anaerobiospirillum thomasii TaxID=179995 RepID=A0A2X0VAG1_9GAMM|nr:transposase [Anaerobiospirillum thomasii]SPT69805.1 Transposase [Anaerobiospirillum thomasii]